MINLPFIIFLNTYGVIILLLSVVFYLWFIEKNRNEALHAVFSAALAAIFTLALKELFDQPRPFVTEDLKPMAGFYTSASFPSMHTSLAFSFTTTVALHQKRLGILLLIIASLIGFGRIAANVHFPEDIIAGAIVGTLIAFLMENVHIPAFPLKKGT